MKTTDFIIIYLLSSFAVILTINSNYTERTKQEFNQMKHPIVLKDKTKRTFWYSVILQDGDGKLYKWGNSSKLANSIGELYTINDTITK